MIRHHYRSGVTVKKTVCVVVLLAGASGAGAGSQEPQDLACGALLVKVREAIQVRSQGDDWAPFDRAVADASRCYERGSWQKSPDLYNLETWGFVERRAFDAALGSFRSFFRCCAAQADSETLAKMHERLGYVYSQIGQPVAKLNQYARAAALADQLSSPTAARVLSEAGEGYRVVGELTTAWQYLTAAESVLVRSAPDPGQRLGLGVARFRLAQVVLQEVHQGRRPTSAIRDKAAPLIQSALALIPASRSTAFFRGHALLVAAESRRMAGEPTAAVPYLEEARRLSPQFSDTYPQLTTEIYRAIGETERQRGRFGDARAAYQQALDVLKDRSLPGELRWTYEGIGRVEEDAAVAAGGELGAAELYLKGAVQQAEVERKAYGTHEWSTTAWEDLQTPHRHLVRVLLRQGRTEEAFLTLDGTRARHLRDVREAVQNRGRLRTTDASRATRVARALERVRQRLSHPAVGLADRMRLEARETELQAQLDAVTVANRTEPALALRSLQKALAARNSVLLSYFLDSDLPTVFVVRADTLVAVQLPVDPPALRRDVERLVQAWEDGAAGSAPHLAPLHTLYRQLFEPIRSLVPRGAPLVLIQDGPIVGLPFGLLLENPYPSFEYASAPYLLRGHPLSVELAAALVMETEGHRAWGGRLLALGKGQFGGRPREADRLDSPTLSDLPGVRAELKRVVASVASARVAFDRRATEALFDEERDGADVIHLATHALVNPAFPAYSRIILSDHPEAPDDGILHLYELQLRPLQARLVTLSGCSTARGAQRVGEGMVGLQYGFRAAGAAATLATLWPVEDQATADLMGRFYHHLSRGAHKDEALQRAQLDYLRSHSGRDALPFVWGAPVLYGDPSPLPLSSAATRSGWGFSLIALVAALASFYRLRARRASYA